MKISKPTQEKVIRAWRELKDFILVLFLLNMLINNIEAMGLNIAKGDFPAVVPAVAEARQQEEEVIATTIYPLVGEFSAFTATEAETDQNPQIMASGKQVYQGAIACPNSYEFGDKIEIENMGVFVCEDRMNSRYRESSHFDIYFDNHSEAIQFGRRQLSFKKL